MSYRAVISNDLSFPIVISLVSTTTGVGTERIIESKQSISVDVDTLTTGFIVKVSFPITVRKDANGTSVVIPATTQGIPNISPPFPLYLFQGPGTYIILPSGSFVSNDLLALKRIIDLILNNTCDIGLPITPVPVWGNYALGPFGQQVGGPGQFPVFPPIGDNCCEDRRFNEIIALLTALLQGKTQSEITTLLNTPVVTFVPLQGQTDVTILEAAIIARWPELVARLLALGASPNVSTSGVPLIEQLNIALQSGQDDPGCIIEIINLLSRASTMTGNVSILPTNQLLLNPPLNDTFSPFVGSPYPSIPIFPPQGFYPYQYDIGFTSVEEPILYGDYVRPGQVGTGDRFNSLY